MGAPKSTHGCNAARIAGLSPAKRRLLGRRISARVRTGSELIAEQLVALGVTHLYAITAVPIDRALAACAAAGIRVIGVHDQRGAGLMALAQNYQAGKPVAAVMVSPGPATTNLATAIHTAQANCWPLLVIGACATCDLREQGEFQELDSVRLFASITKFSALVESVGEVPRMLVRASQLAAAGRPGPVFLGIAADVFEAAADVPLPSEKLPLPKREGLARAHLLRAAQMLHTARRPLMILGKGLRWSAPFSALADLANACGIPFVTSPMGRGYLPDTHPLCFNAVRAQALAEADVVLVLGARLDWTFRFGSELRPRARLIHIDIEAAEIGRNVETTLGIVADLGQALEGLVGALKDSGSRTAATRDGVWIGNLQRQREERQRRIAAIGDYAQSPLSPHRLVSELAQVLPEDAVCILDGATIMAAAQQLLPALHPVSRYTPGSNGCLGVGVPFAIGVKLQLPARPVVAVCGDLSVGFSIMELETAGRYELPVVVVVANNQGPFGLNKQRRYYPEDYPDRVAGFAEGVRYEQICQALGGHGELVERPEQFRSAWERALASGKPACINVLVEPTAAYPGRD
jgi:2-hydroxyacyl-CoA lyase 1